GSDLKGRETLQQFFINYLYIDECAAKMHYCHANTVCVNLPGLYRCDCIPGYIRVDDFSCTDNEVKRCSQVGVGPAEVMASCFGSAL
ncbi:protein kinase C-binding protein NELL2-like protein, partial [Cricetulus griseus]